MKKGFIKTLVFMLVTASLIFTSCGSEKKKDNKSESVSKVEETSELLKKSEEKCKEMGIEFKVTDSTSSGLKYELINNSEKEYRYGAEYTILSNEKEPKEVEKKLEGEFSFQAVGLYLKAGEKVQEEVDWSSFIYGNLPAGSYIFKKHITLFEGGSKADDFDVATVFEIE